MPRVDFRVRWNDRENAEKGGLVFDGDSQTWCFDSDLHDPKWVSLLRAYPDVYLTGYRDDDEDDTNCGPMLHPSAAFDKYKARWYGHWHGLKRIFSPHLAVATTKAGSGVFLQEMMRWETQPVPGVYVVKLDNGTIYVGKSKDMHERLQKHMKGNSAMWCKSNGSSDVRVLPTETPRLDDLSLWEQQETLLQMVRHGPNKVRGWIFTKDTPLTNDEINVIYRMIVDRTDSCFKCGAYGHYSNRCKATSDACWKRKFTGLPTTEYTNTTSSKRSKRGTK